MRAGTEVLLNSVNLHGNRIFAMLYCKEIMAIFLVVEKMLLY